MTNDFGIDPVKDYLPYAAAFFGWLGQLDWLLICSLLIAAFRCYVAFKEYKLKREKYTDQKDVRTANATTKTETTENE